MKKILFIIYFLLISGLGFGFYYFYHNKIVISNNNQIVQNKCLSENEIADYKINKKQNKVSTADIIISDKKNGQERYKFQIEIPIPNHYHPVELHKCGVYAARDFNYDYIKKITSPDDLPNYKIELWQYDYSGKGKSLVFLSGPISGSGFSSDFRVDSSEKSIVLIKSYLGKDDHALVIKDINTKEDILSVKLKDIVQKYPNVIGTIGLIKWTDDGRYFWADIFDGAYTKGFIRVDSKDWSYQILEMPNDMDIGITGPVNFNTGYVTLHPGVVWTGVVEVTQQISEQWLKEGKQSKMYLYNLFTKERILIVTTDKPLWEFNPKWISDTELQYELPTGEKKIYKIQ